MILTENSGMWLASEKFIPQLLVVEEKKTDICTDLLKQVDKEENVMKFFSTAVPLPSSPADTYLFPELKVSVMGYQCESVEEIQDTPLE